MATQLGRSAPLSECEFLVASGRARAPGDPSRRSVSQPSRRNGSFREGLGPRSHDRELVGHPDIDKFRSTTGPQTSRARSARAAQPETLPRFYRPSSRMAAAKNETSRELRGKPPRPTSTLKYVGCPPTEPRLRPKRTSTGLEERMLKSGGYGVRIHWDEYAGYHIHASAPEVDLMHADQVLMVRDSPTHSRESDKDAAGSPPGGLSASLSPVRKATKKAGPVHCGVSRQCIPVYQFAPTLCEKSREIIDVYRKERVAHLWKKVDARREGVVDLFQLASRAPSRKTSKLRSSGMDAKSPDDTVLSSVEERFVQACVMQFVQIAVSRTSAQLVKDGATLGPHFDDSLRFTTAGAQGSENPPVVVPTEQAVFPHPHARDPMREGLQPDAEAEGAKIERENATAIQAAKRLARQHNQVIMLNVDANLGADASATPALFVPRKKFESVALEALAHEFGNPDIDVFRDHVMCECRKLVEKVNPEEAQRFFKPYILEYSRKLDARRRRAKAQEREESGRRAASLSADCYGPQGKFPTVGLRRVENRFDEQIEHYLRKKQQLHHLKEALDEMREGQFCTFHPAVNPYPKYLKQAFRLRRSPDDPLVILERFCEQYTEDREYPRLVEAIRECTFQPNIHKFVAKEKQLQATGVEVSQEKEKGITVPGKRTKEAHKQTTEDKPAAMESRVDHLFQSIERPFDHIFAADINQWLETDANLYSSQEDGAEKRKKQRWKRWEVEGRAPQYRGALKDRSQRALLTQDGGEVVVQLVEETEERAPVVLPRHRTTPYNDWVNGLRGGYLPNVMDFQKGPTEKGDRKKAERFNMRDWSRHIRLSEREVETRIIPNEEIIDAVCESELPSAAPPPPTIWVRRRRWEPAPERGPDAPTFTEAHFHTGSDRQTDRLLPAGKPAALTQQQAKEYKNRFASSVDPTTFVVPTPLKLDRLRQQYRLYMQLRNGIETGEIRTPPKVVTLRRDVLTDLEKEVKREPPTLVLAETRDAFASDTVETDNSVDGYVCE
ncbi:hypothetical protein TGGT1_225020 [Toxoplasma gondii GT1]|uniref:Uncharacterized protein n=2 Tax=Toxoplasma gondii TaxID=5811 RepID=S7W514_TOXGG|nr:hypothetical protein TGGT1_225020 [Toxoplasma gondii GT1]KAF4640545.1 hypothetical protein TGRH88_044710 [Toxoplasma gondii]